MAKVWETLKTIFFIAIAILVGIPLLFLAQGAVLAASAFVVGGVIYLLLPCLSVFLVITEEYLHIPLVVIDNESLNYTYCNDWYFIPSVLVAIMIIYFSVEFWKKHNQQKQKKMNNSYVQPRYQSGITSKKYPLQKYYQNEKLKAQVRQEKNPLPPPEVP